jgi:hypothetical protein
MRRYNATQRLGLMARPVSPIPAAPSAGAAAQLSAPAENR